MRIFVIFADLAESRAAACWPRGRRGAGAQQFAVAVSRGLMKIIYILTATAADQTDYKSWLQRGMRRSSSCAASQTELVVRVSPYTFYSLKISS